MARTTLSATIQAAERFLEQERFDDAHALARIILDALPGAVAGQRLLAQAELGRKDYSSARESFHRLLEFNPLDHTAHLGLAHAAEATGDTLRALEELSLAAEVSPNRDDARADLVRVRRLAGEEDTGRLKITRAALAFIYARGQMSTRAIPEFRAVLDEDPTRHDVRLGLAEALWRDGDGQGALEEAQAVLEHLPRSVLANLIAAAALSASGLEQQAQTLRAEAEAADPLGQFGQALFGPDGPYSISDPELEVPAHLLASLQTTAPEVTELDLPEWLLRAQAKPRPSSTRLPVEETSPDDHSDEEVDAWLGEISMPRPAPQGTEGAYSAWRAYEDGDLEAAWEQLNALVQAETELSAVVPALGVIVAQTGREDFAELLADAQVRAGQFEEALAGYTALISRLQAEGRNSRGRLAR